jgi:hypothetical protein
VYQPIRLGGDALFSSNMAVEPESRPHAPVAGVSTRADGFISATAIGTALTTLWSARHFSHDDAFISFRYVERLWSGHGLTWTAGPPVEGFTHPLWILLLAAAHPLPVPLPDLARAFGLLSLGALFFVWTRARLSPDPLLVLAAFPGLILWTLGGLETVPFCLCLLVGYVQTGRILSESGPEPARAPLFAGLAFSAAGLLRPEGAACGLLALGTLVALGKRRSAVAMLVPLALPLAAYGTFRVVWFHDFVPNSARVKVFAIAPRLQIASAWEYLRTGCARFHAFRGAAETAWAPPGLSPFGLSEWLPPTVFGVGFILSRRSRSRLLALLLAAPVLLSAISGGGDHMRGMRLLVPFVALVLAGAASGTPRAPRAFRVLALLTAAWNLACSTAWSVDGDRSAAIGAQIGRYLEHRLPARSVVATNSAGSTAFFAPSQDFLDTLGLNDRVIAARPVTELRTFWQGAPGHRKGDGAYVLARKPDVIVIGPTQGMPANENVRIWFLGDLELAESKEFREQYEGLATFIPIDRSLTSVLPLPADLEAIGSVPFVFYVRRGSPIARALAPQGPRSR